MALLRSWTLISLCTRVPVAMLHNCATRVSTVYRDTSRSGHTVVAEASCAAASYDAASTEHALRQAVRAL